MQTLITTLIDYIITDSDIEEYMLEPLIEAERTQFRGTEWLEIIVHLIKYQHYNAKGLKVLEYLSRHMMPSTIYRIYTLSGTDLNLTYQTAKQAQHKCDELFANNPEGNYTFYSEPLN